MLILISTSHLYIKLTNFLITIGMGEMYTPVIE